MRAIVLIGPQGSGKGTQAKELAKHYKIPHISTGDVLRGAVKEGTELGKKAKAIMDEGGLVPNEIVNGMVQERLAKDDCKEGFLLDGYPRTLEQAEVLDGFCDINFVFEISIPDELSIKRICNRRQCKECGAIFGLDIPPKEEGKCDKCGGALYQRDDDKEEAIKKRLEAYHDKTEPLIEYYKPRDIVFNVDGTKAVAEVFEEMVGILG